MKLIKTNEKADKLLYYNRFCFKIAFIVTMMLCCIPYVHNLIGGYIKLLLLWGTASVGADLLTGAQLIRNKFTALLLAFCISYAVTVLLNHGMNFADNAKNLLYMIVIFIMLFSQNLSLSREQVTREMRIISLVFVILSLLMSFVCFMTYVLSIDITYFASGSFMYIGMFENRLWGLYNPNTGSSINTLSIILTTYLLLSKKKKSKLLTAFFIVNYCIQVFCLILTSSRAALYVLYIAVALLIFYLLPTKWLKERNAQNYLFRIAAAGLSILLIMGSFSVIKTGLSYVPSIVKSVSNIGNESGNGFEIEKEDLERLDDEKIKSENFLTGRQYLWNAGLNAFKQSPVFGITRQNIPEKAAHFIENNKAVGNTTELVKSLEEGGLHNIYVTILTSSGIVGFLLMGAFAVWTIIKMFIALFKKKFVGSDRLHFICAFVLIAIFYVMELFEARILYNVNLFYLIFWTYYGFAMYFTQKDDSVAEKKSWQ